MTKAGVLILNRSLQTGFLTSTQLGSIRTLHGYSVYGELSDIRSASSSQNLLQQHFNYDVLGRIAEKIETINGVVTLDQYSYDLGGHLMEVRRNGISIAHYDYDANGNRIGGQTLMSLG